MAVVISDFSQIEDFQSTLECGQSFEDELCLEDILALTEKVKAWDEELKPAEDVLEGYFGIKIPREKLIGVLIKNLNLAYETYSDGISDTCCRDMLITAVLNEYNLPNWPTYGDVARHGKQYEENFYAQLKDAGIYAAG